MRRQEELGDFLTILKADLEDARQNIENIEELQVRTSDLESANEQLLQERKSLKTKLVECKQNMEELRQERDSFRQRDEQIKRDIGSFWGW
jgi:phage shock protein A